MTILANILRKLSPCVGSWMGLFFGMLLLLMASCTPSTDCRQTENVRCVVLFINGKTQNPIAFDSLTVQGVGSDSILVKNQKKVNKLSLPLRTDTTATSFLLTSGSYKETITIYHTPAPYFISMACGCFVYHTIDTIETTNVRLTEAEILNTAVQNTPEDNIRLFFHLPSP